MAVSTASRIKFEYMLGGGPPVLVELGQQSDTTGWRVGAPVEIDASGHFTVVTTGNMASTDPGFLGIATENSCTSVTGDGTHKALVLLATPQTVFSAVVAHATTASATVQTAQLHKSYKITSSGTVCPTSEVWVMDVETTGAGGYVIANKDATGTAYGRNYFIFNRIYSTVSPFGYATG